MEIVLWDILILYQISNLTQVKRSATISNKLGVYELPHELPKDLSSGLGSQEIRKNQENLKVCQNYKVVPSLLAKMKILSILAKNFGKVEIELFPQALIYMKIRVCLNYFLNDCLLKYNFPANSPRTPSKLIV